MNFQCTAPGYGDHILHTLQKFPAKASPFGDFMPTSVHPACLSHSSNWSAIVYEVNGLDLYSAFIQSALQFMPLIHPFTHQRRLAAMQGTNQLVRSNWGLGALLRDTSTRPGWDRTGDPLTARRQLLPPEPHTPLTPIRCSPRQHIPLVKMYYCGPIQEPTNTGVWTHFQNGKGRLTVWLD